MSSATERFLPQLLEGDTDVSLELFGGSGDVDDVFKGQVDELFYFWAAQYHIWLHDRDARIEPVAVTRAAGRAVVEVVLHLSDKERGAIALPVALVGEETEDDRLRRVTIYHTTWPFYGRHYVRLPLLEPNPELVAPDVVGEYQEALARGDVEKILGLFTDDAVVREPSGGAYTHATPEARRAFYGSILAGGGIELQHCRITDDGKACAIEYNVVRWGEQDLAPQAGVAVYVRAPDGRLGGARIYDDVEPPG
jgi:SnoaL-like protein